MPCCRSNCSTNHSKRILEAEVVEDPGVQPLRLRADLVERLLRDAAHLLELDDQRRSAAGLPLRAAEQRADGREDLAEVVVQLARERLLQVFLHPQHPPRQVAQLRADVRRLLEGAPVRRRRPRRRRRP